MTGPGGERWEVYTVLADSETFGESPQTAAEDTGVCCGTAADETPASACC